MKQVISVCKSSKHNFSKTPCSSINIVEGEGIEGDAHRGKTVKHRSRVKKNPDAPNLRQVHLIGLELIQELQEKGFNVKPSSMGENITTIGVDLLSLPTNTLLNIGANVVLQVTGLRNPCYQLDNFQKGLTAAVLDRDETGKLIRKAGIMSVVLTGGVVNKNDLIEIVIPKESHIPLEPV